MIFYVLNDLSSKTCFNMHITNECFNLLLFLNCFIERDKDKTHQYYKKMMILFFFILKCRYFFSFKIENLNITTS